MDAQGDDRAALSQGAALFERRGDLFCPSLYAQGPWAPDLQFGGAPAALVATLVEEVPALVPMQVARPTVDLLRPVPLAPLQADVAVVREGKRIQVIGAALLADGIEVVRATALRLRVGDLGEGDVPDGRAPTPLPLGPRETDDEIFPMSPPGSRLAVEYLHQGVGGFFRAPTWVRLRVAVIAGRAARPVARLAYTADLASGIGHRPELPYSGINADLTVNIVRHPEGEWLCQDGVGWISRSGIGQVQATISDSVGMCATVSMARLVERLAEA